MPMNADQLLKAKQKARDDMQRLERWQLRRMREKCIGSPRAFRFDKQIRALKSLLQEITPEKYKTLNAAQREGALRGAERWCERDEAVIRQRRALRRPRQPGTLIGAGGNRCAATGLFPRSCACTRPARLAGADANLRLRSQAVTAVRVAGRYRGPTCWD